MQVVGSHYSMVQVWHGVYTDDATGYVADVKYEGVPHYPEEPKYAPKPAPKYAPAPKYPAA